MSVDVSEGRRVGRSTQGVGDLRRTVDGHLHTAFPHRIWVSGRVGRTERDEVGSFQLTLGASTGEESFQVPCLLAADVLPEVRDTLDRLHDADVEDVLVEGRLARLGGLLRYDFEHNSLVLLVSELDPAPTVAGLAESRVLARARAAERGLVDRQRACPGAVAPLRIGLVGRRDDEALAQVRDDLLGSGYRVDLREVPADLSGAAAPASVAGAVHEAAVCSDLVLLLRSSGRPLSLGAFDSDEVALEVARSAVPVVCAVGGDGAATVVDDVAHASLPDAPAAAAWVLDRLDSARGQLADLRASVGAESAAAAERVRALLAETAGDVEEVAREAALRADAVRRRTLVRALAVTAFLLVVLGVAAFAFGQPLLLLGALVPVVLLLAAWGVTRLSTTATRRGARPMSRPDEDFTGVLERLRHVRRELATTSSPEAVRRLRGVAAGLVAQGEAVLGRELEPVGHSAAASAAQPSVSSA